MESALTTVPSLLPYKPGFSKIQEMTSVSVLKGSQNFTWDKKDPGDNLARVFFYQRTYLYESSNNSNQNWFRLKFKHVTNTDKQITQINDWPQSIRLRLLVQALSTREPPRTNRLKYSFLFSLNRARYRLSKYSVFCPRFLSEILVWGIYQLEEQIPRYEWATNVVYWKSFPRLFSK